MIDAIERIRFLESEVARLKRGGSAPPRPTMIDIKGMRVGSVVDLPSEIIPTHNYPIIYTAGRYIEVYPRTNDELMFVSRAHEKHLARPSNPSPKSSKYRDNPVFVSVDFYNQFNPGEKR